jgi:hypothetical protein
MGRPRWVGDRTPRDLDLQLAGWRQMKQEAAERKAIADAAIQARQAQEAAIARAAELRRQQEADARRPKTLDERIAIQRARTVYCSSSVPWRLP